MPLSNEPTARWILDQSIHSGHKALSTIILFKSNSVSWGSCLRWSWLILIAKLRQASVLKRGKELAIDMKMSLYSHANKTLFFFVTCSFFFHLAWFWKGGFWNSEMANWILLHRVNSDRTQQGGRGTKTLCAKRDSNFVWNYVSPNITSL